MKFFAALILSGILGLAPVYAADNTTDCSDADNQIEMNDCAAKAYQIADQQLNMAYKQAQKHFDKGGQEKLKEAQKQWISYRDAQCAVEAYDSEGGSIQPVIINNCLERLTVQQAENVRQTMPAGQ